MNVLREKLNMILSAVGPQKSAQEEILTERKTSVSGGDRRELSVCSIHPQSDAHMTKVWK